MQTFPSWIVVNFHTLTSIIFSFYQEQIINPMPFYWLFSENIMQMVLICRDIQNNKYILNIYREVSLAYEEKINQRVRVH